MRHMTASIDRLMGVAKVVISSTDWLAESSGGVHRIDVQLDRSMMTVALRDLVARLPSHLLWYGVAFKLLYVGCLMRGLVASADYPFVLPEARGEEEESVLAGGRPARNEEGTADESTAAGAKRRRAVSGG